MNDSQKSISTQNENTVRNGNKITSAWNLRCGWFWFERWPDAAMWMERIKSQRASDINHFHLFGSFALWLSRHQFEYPPNTRMSHGTAPICAHSLMWTQWNVSIARNSLRKWASRHASHLRWTINHQWKPVGDAGSNDCRASDEKNFSNFNLNLAVSFIGLKTRPLRLLMKITQPSSSIAQCTFPREFLHPQRHLSFCFWALKYKLWSRFLL